MYCWQAGSLLVTLCLIANHPFVTAQAEQATIGVLIDLHFPKHHSRASSNSQTAKDTQCGPLNPVQFQHLMAAEWAAQVVSNQTSQQRIRIGIDVFDSCGDADRAMRDVFFAVKAALDPRRKVPLLGVIGLGDPDVVSETLTTLHAFNIPLILASPRLTEMVNQEGNILTSAPDISGVVKPILTVAKQMGVTAISVISTCPYSITKFSQFAVGHGMIIKRVLQLDKHSKVMGDIAQKFLDKSDVNETIALVLEPEEMYTLGDQLRSYEHPNITLIIGVIGLNKNLLKLWRNLFGGSYLVEPHMPELPDFRNYLLETMQSAQTDEKPLMREYMSNIYNCLWDDDNKSNATINCKDLQFNDLAHTLQINPEVIFVVKAVSAYSAALFLHCNGRILPNCTNTKPGEENLQQEILATLSQLSFTSQHNVPFELQGTSHRVTHEGQLIPNKYVVNRIEETGDVLQLGWYSDDLGLALDETVASEAIFRDSNKKLSAKTQQQVFDSQSFPKFSVKKIQIKNHMMTSLGTEDVDAKRVTPESSISRPWATVIVSVAAVGISFTLFIIVYVLLKICDGTLAGNQSLGLILLFGILIIYASIPLFVMPANEIRCSIRTFLHPLALSLCYGILIIKVMQLRSLVLLGLGGRISYINQYIILFFIVLVQVVVNIQWFFLNQPQCRLDTSGTATCSISRENFLLLHLYTIILLFIAFFYGLSVLKIRRNHKEGHWVTLAAFLSLPVFVVCGLIFSMAPDRFDEPVVCIALILLASILIMTIYIPKVSTISHQSKHFRHKKIHMANSVTTVFTTYTNLHNAPGYDTGRKKYFKTPIHAQPLNASMLDSHSDNITKNPIYEVTNGGYP